MFLFMIRVIFSHFKNLRSSLLFGFRTNLKVLKVEAHLILKVLKIFSLFHLMFLFTLIEILFELLEFQSSQFHHVSLTLAFYLLHIFLLQPKFIGHINFVEFLMITIYFVHITV